MKLPSLAPTTRAPQIKDYGSDRADESASVGYFGVTLSRYLVKTELAATRRAALHRYTFARGGESHILLEKTTLRLEDGGNFVIVARHLDAAYHYRYVQSATLNGQPLNQAWFRHSDIKEGGELILNMGDRPSGWGAQNPPPSLSDEDRNAKGQLGIGKQGATR